MKVAWKFVLVSSLVLQASLFEAQVPYYGRRRGVNPGSPGTLGAYQGVVVTFHGKLKDRDKQKIDIETDENQVVEIRVSGKTKFLKNGKAIKASDIDLETHVTVDASEDKDLSVLAVAVTVDPPPQKTEAK